MRATCGAVGIADGVLGHVIENLPRGSVPPVPNPLEPPDLRFCSPARPALPLKGAGVTRYRNHQTGTTSPTPLRRCGVGSSLSEPSLRENSMWLPLCGSRGRQLLGSNQYVGPLGSDRVSR